MGNWNTRRLLFLLAAGLLGACDDGAAMDAGMADGGAIPDAGEVSDAGAMPDAGFDAGAPPSDAGAPPGCDDVAPTVVDGVLTTAPDIGLRLTPTDFRFLTANFYENSLGAAVLLAEVRNDGTERRCGFSPEVTAGSLPRFAAGLHTRPYFTLTDTITEDCLEPGETGVLSAWTSEPLSAVRATRIVDVQLTPNDFGMPREAVGPYVEGERLVSGPGGTRVEGTLVADVAVENVLFRAYPRDSRGVLIAELLGTPSDLGAIPRGARIPFATGEVSCPVMEVESFLSWIVTATP